MSQPLYLAFIWHMHQPYYRDRRSGRCTMPWVRLHATKDYIDMVKRLESFPAIHQTFNMVPALLDQLEEYLPPANLSDAFLDLSRRPAAELSVEEQRFILQWFFMANLERMIKPHARYHDLLAKRGLHVAEEDWPRILKRFRTQDYLDLQVWFNLVWIDPWLRSQDALLQPLVVKGSYFSEAEKQVVLTRHASLLAEIIPVYRAATARGQIELTTSPYFHPIMPLLCDLRVALATLPHVTLPAGAFRHPEDARRQLKEALTRHTAAFGQAANGLWPPEGSVSEDLVRLCTEAGIRWIATDEEILWRTLRGPRAPSQLYRPHALRRKHGELAILFRDRELSDLIGFVYSQWDPAIAVTDFLKRLEQIHAQFQAVKPPALVSIILDGENAWEAYPNDGHEFLMRLYEALSRDERFRCVTVSEFLQQHPPARSESLPELVSGSWIDGNFATWIGHPEKNAAWTLLAQAKEALAASPREARDAAWPSLAAAEGSDWMWWFGDTHFSAQADEFDRLFRLHLTNAYECAGLEAPASLTQPIRRRLALSTHGPTGLLTAIIDGRETTYYEWLYAGRIDLTQQYAAIHRGQQCLRRLVYGFDHTHQYLRLDLDRPALEELASWTIELALSHELTVRIEPSAGSVTAWALADRHKTFPCALDRLLELAIPRSTLHLQPGERLRLSLSLSQGREVLEHYPAEGAFELNASPEDLEAQAWLV